MTPFGHLVGRAAAALLMVSAAALAVAQTAPPRMPELIASNECEPGKYCVRQMLQYRQFSARDQARLQYLIGVLPSQPAGAGGSSTSCSAHTHGGGHATIVCLDIRAEGTCACTITTTGSHCIGTNPYCPVTLN